MRSPAPWSQVTDTLCDAERIVGLISAQAPELQTPGPNLELKRAFPPTGSIPARAGQPNIKLVLCWAVGGSIRARAGNLLPQHASACMLGPSPPVRGGPAQLTSSCM